MQTGTTKPESNTIKRLWVFSEDGEVLTSPFHVLRKDGGIYYLLIGKNQQTFKGPSRVPSRLSPYDSLMDIQGKRGLSISWSKPWLKSFFFICTVMERWRAVIICSLTRFRFWQEEAPVWGAELQEEGRSPCFRVTLRLGDLQLGNSEPSGCSWLWIFLKYVVYLFFPHHDPQCVQSRNYSLFFFSWTTWSLFVHKTLL